MSLRAVYLIFKVPTCTLDYIYDLIVGRSIQVLQFPTIRNIQLFGLSSRVFKFSNFQVFECSYFQFPPGINFLLRFQRSKRSFETSVRLQRRSLYYLIDALQFICSLHRGNPLAQSFRDQWPCASERR